MAPQWPFSGHPVAPTVAPSVAPSVAPCILWKIYNIHYKEKTYQFVYIFFVFVNCVKTPQNTGGH